MIYDLGLKIGLKRKNSLEDTRKGYLTAKMTLWLLKITRMDFER